MNYWEIILAASIPLWLWIAVSALLWWKARGAEYRFRVNILASAGAILAFVSLATAWGVVERGYDWSGTTSVSLFLLATYPLALVTPLAGFGQAGILLWTIGFASPENTTIEPISGYLVAWISVILMVAGIVWPVALPRSNERPAVYDRVLTLTFRQISGPWMALEHTVTVLYVLLALAVGALCVVTDAPSSAYAILSIGLVFVWLLQARVPKREGVASKRHPSANLMARLAGRKASEAVGKGTTAWVLYLVLAYSALVVAVDTFARAFGAGFSGEEKTAGLVLGSAVLGVIVPLGVIAWRRARPPNLPRNVVLASMSGFAAFVLLAALSLTHLSYWYASAREYLIFAGIMLVVPVWIHLRDRPETNGRKGNLPGSLT